ncbi:hypothetical protein BDR06DRAFT_967893 [Suillus hirtellus]|nr:hypothetical protein BDR06DRAFT_967893 [Suillus hirtellus]
MVMYKQFGDGFQHESWIRSKTLEQLEIIHSHAHPDDLEDFFHEAQKFCLNGMDKPFWWDWLLAEPSQFFTPESLHHIHKEFWDHDVHPLLVIDTFMQSPCIDNKDLSHITATLDEFHANKHVIIIAGVHQGKGSKVINNWQIPKLELMQNIIPSICNSGVIAQWSADVTKHAHITKVKDPARSSNNHNYDLQICYYLDCADKCNQFDFATSLSDCSEDLGVVGEEIVEEDDKIDDDKIDDNENELPESHDLLDNAEDVDIMPCNTLGMFQSLTAAAAYVMTS